MSAKIQEILNLVKELNVIEINELVSAFEEEFGVSAAAMVVAGGGAGGAASDDGGANDKVTVMLDEIGQQKIGVIKVVKEVLGLDLKAAKDLVEQAPVAIKEKIEMEEAEDIKAKLIEVGATASFK